MITTPPSVGRIVHYVSRGSADGVYPSVCRAAIVTEVPEGVASPITVGLAVLNPTGVFFDRSVPYDEGGETPGDPNCLSGLSHGNPFRYCACGWIEDQLRPGTWHWPERV